MVRVLHTADLHLDTSFRGLSAKKARIRREEQRELLSRLQLLVAEQNIDIVLIAGDLFDGDAVYYETTKLLAETFDRMEAKIFVAPGNHDPYTENSAYRTVKWPENVHVFRSEGMERIELPELGAVVYGTAFVSKYRDNSPLQNFRHGYDDDMVRLMVMHGDLSPSKSRYAHVTAAEIEKTEMDYVAVGHIHKHFGVWKEGVTSFAYSGCPEGRGFDETGEKGVLVGTVEREHAQMEFVPLGKRQYREILVDVTGREPKEALLQAIGTGYTDDICRFRLVGERDCDQIAIPYLSSLVQKYAFEVQVVDETVLKTDIWSRADEDTLTGLFLRNMRTRMENADESELPVLEKALQFGIAALEGREEPK